MDTLMIEPAYRVVLGEINRFRILVVGAGGTGSTLALFLAGLAFHARQQGIEVDLTLVDHVVVELKNCGRQAVSLQAALVGNVPKVADLALRLNAAYGLDIVAWPQAVTAARIHAWMRDGRRGRACAHLMIGCVDNHLARREMAQGVAEQNGRLWAIDCGNEQHSGQVLIGNLAPGMKVQIDPLGLCNGLPSPYVQEPDLLAPDSHPAAHSCAEMALAETQSVMVNRMAATIAAQYTAVFVLQKQILQMGTRFTLDPPTARSSLITQSELGSVGQVGGGDVNGG